MTHESRPISRGELSDFIKESAKNEAVKIEEREQAIIDQIVASFPDNSENKSSASIGKWCNNQVDQILQRHPELKDESERIRQRVRMELVYLFNEPEFNNLKETIDREKPEKITPIWIRKNARRVAGLVNNNHLDWQLVSEKLKVPIEEQPKSFQDIMDRVNKELKDKDPDVISPQYFIKHLQADYLYFRRNILDTQGMIDWDRVLFSMDPQFQERWNRRAVYEEVKPTNTYRDPDELNQFLETHKDKLFTIVEAGPAERESREEVIQGLVNLAKKWNELALEKAFEYSTFIVQSWILEKRLPFTLNDYKDEVDDRIKRSIYLYRNQGPYLTYLFVSLARLGRGFKNVSTTFNETSGGHNQTNGNGKHNSKQIFSNENFSFRDEPDDSYDY
jgi:hypothetical protein